MTGTPIENSVLDLVNIFAFVDPERIPPETPPRLLPDLTRDEILWRFHFMLGTIYYTASGPHRIRAYSNGRCDPADIEENLRHLIPFLAVAFRGPSVKPVRRKPHSRKRKP